MTFEGFANHPAFASNMAPVSSEADADDLPVVGLIPDMFEGTLYRIGPNPRFAPVDGSRHHWFLGDGMIHAFRFAAGRVSYRSRWVRTRKWQREDEAGRTLFEGWGYRPVGGGPPPGDLDGTANTSLAWHANRLFALAESSVPIEVDPDTLATRGPESFGSRLGNSFTAHYKIDPLNGELVAFGAQSAGFGSRQMHYYTISAGGALTTSQTFEAPYPCFAHDFLVTQTHVVIPVCPLAADAGRARSGGEPYAWDPALATMIGIFPRSAGPAAIRWFQGPASYIFHVFNAYDDAAGGIVADVLEYSQPPLFPDTSGAVPANEDVRSAVTRWRFDLARDDLSYDREIICDSPAHSLEFPQIDPRVATLKHRIGYFVGRETPDRIGFNTLARVDFDTGDVEHRRYGPEDMLSEALFIPATADAEEEDGYLAFLLYKSDTRTSELHVQRADAIGADPVAVVKLTHRVPQGFHGIWRSAA